MTSEKRILIREIKPECKFSAIHETTAGGHSWIDYLCCNPSIIHTNRECDDNRLEKCKYKDLEGLARQEAIERMAKAMCHRFAEGCEECKSCGLSCKDYLETEGYMSDAEAALNALLEAQNER